MNEKLRDIPSSNLWLVVVFVLLTLLAVGTFLEPIAPDYLDMEARFQAHQKEHKLRNWAPFAGCGP